jgi:nicotinamide riboside transporter PnuC
MYFAIGVEPTKLTALMLFWSQDLKFTSLLYVAFAAIALRGWINWQKLQRADSQ